MLGFSRDTFYRVEELHDAGGPEALKEISRRKPNRKNRIAPEIEEKIIELAIELPAYGQVRISNELRKEGMIISPAGVRCVWQRHGLETMKKRLAALEEKVAKEGVFDFFFSISEIFCAKYPWNLCSSCLLPVKWELEIDIP